jgi:hypothetical protein
MIILYKKARTGAVLRNGEDYYERYSGSDCTIFTDSNVEHDNFYSIQGHGPLHEKGEEARMLAGPLCTEAIKV